MAARRPAQTNNKPITGVVMAAAIAGAGAAIYYGYPGLIVVWAGFLVSAWTHPPAILSGKKDSRGYPTPLHDGEQVTMNKYRFWSELKFKLIVPSADWLPGLKVQLSWLLAVWAAFAAVLLPVHNDYTGNWGEWVNVAAAYITIAQFSASRRRTEVHDDVNPGAQLPSLLRIITTEPGKFAGLMVGGLAVGAVIGTVLTVMVPYVTKLSHVAPISEPALWTLSLTIGVLIVLSRPWIEEALKQWRIVVAARAEWALRWQTIDKDPYPRLIDHRTVGQATIDTFEAPASNGAIAYFGMYSKIGPAMGTGNRYAMADVPNLDPQGNPVPGTNHPLRFEVIQWPSDQTVDPTDPSVPADVMTEWARSAMFWMSNSLSSGRPVVNEVTKITVDAPADDSLTGAPSPAVWAITCYYPGGPGAKWLRENALRDLASAFGAETLIDRKDIIFVGALEDDVHYDPSAGVNVDTMVAMQTELQWERRWYDIMKQGYNPPVLQYEVCDAAPLKNDVIVHKEAFVTRNNQPPTDFFNYDDNLTSVLNGAPYATVTGWPASGGKLGDRHTQAITVYWSSGVVPTKPEELAPRPDSKAPQWVAAGMINKAFHAARLARPELATATCLTDKMARRHIWRFDIKLYGGVTLAEVRGAAQKIRQNWSTDWLRIAPYADGVTIVAGAVPSKTRLAERRHERYLAALDWEQAFLDAKITGVGGLMPKLVEVDHMEHNPDVSVLTFDLAGTGISPARLKEARTSLTVTSNNTFIDIRTVKDNATLVQILAAEVSPMPDHAPYDYAAIDKAKGIPFATGVEGEPVEFDIKDHIHLMVVGGSGSGKSVILEALITGALRRDCDVYIADPTKGAADFAFAEPYSKAFCPDLISTGAMMKSVYKEVQRRVALNTKYQVGSYRNLPEDVRPNHIILVLDEFTSLISPDMVGKPSDDPDVEAERELALAINEAKNEIGAFTGKIAREARSAGVTLLLATQKLTQKDLDTMPGGSTLKVNLSRLIAGKSTLGERMSALKDAMAAPVMGEHIPPGRAIFEPVTSGPVMIQCWYDKGEQQALSAYISTFRKPLADDEKIDLDQYKRKAPSLRGGGGTVSDLGEMELSMDDLDLGEIELSLDDLDDVESDTAAPGEQSQDEPDMEIRTDSDTALILDMDGTVAPEAHAPGMDTLTVPGSGQITYRPEIVSALARLDARIVWLSNREHEAQVAFPQIPAPEVLTGGSDQHGWWKIDALLAWTQENPQVRHVVWADDELNTEDDILGLTFAELTADALALNGIAFTPIIPDPREGIIGAELAAIEAALRGNAATAPIEQPADDPFESLFSTTSSEDPGSVSPAVDDESLFVPEPQPATAPVDDFDDFTAVAIPFHRHQQTKTPTVEDDDPFT